MDAYTRIKTGFLAALEVFLLFFGFVFSQAVITFVLVIPYTFAVGTRLAEEGLGANQAFLEIARAVSEDFLPHHTVTVSILSALLSLGVLLPVMKKLHPPLKDTLGFHKRPIKSFFPLFPLGVGLQIFISILLSWVMRLPAMEAFSHQMEEYTALISGGNNRLWELLAVVVAAPLCEELFFRGAIQSALKRTGMPLWTAVLIQAALFGLVHGLPLQMAYAFLIGVIFGFLTETQGCIWHSVLLHALFNAAGYWSELPGEEISPVTLIFLFLCASAVCVAALLQIFRTPKEKGERHAT